jgi:hypothetical protein
MNASPSIPRSDEAEVAHVHQIASVEGSDGREGSGEERGRKVMAGVGLVLTNGGHCENYNGQRE